MLKYNLMYHECMHFVLTDDVLSLFLYFSHKSIVTTLTSIVTTLTSIATKVLSVFVDLLQMKKRNKNYGVDLVF